MRIVAISDTHSRHDKVKVPGGDVLVHAGDWTMGGNGIEVRAFARWLADLPHPRKLVTPGNHDMGCGGGEVRAVFEDAGAELVIDAAVVVDGVKFYLSPWTPRFYHWDWMLDRGSSIARKWAEIPDDVDVLVTHGPPFGVGDLVPAATTGTLPKHAGCHDLLARVREVRPQFHIFGHIHDGYGRYRADDPSDVVFVNAAICDEAYRPVNAPQVIDL